MNIFGVSIGICEGSMVIFSLLAMVFWIWMLLDCITNEASHGNTKIVWVIVILLGHLLGAILYFFLRRPVRMSGR